MNIVDIINKKRNGKELTKEEIRYWIRGLTDDSIANYQSSALAMAIVLNGMSNYETYCLTGAMRHSGDILDLSKIDGIKVDKHSTGGVGDKTSLVLGPMVAACGVKVAKMSGRGLGHTGGTLDKLESIPGLTTNVSEKDFIRQVNNIGLAIISQTKSLAPADKKLYALRDVTGTVDSIPLIASSIMSKKLASGADAILLDVTVGSGAFMKNEEDATKLAKLMIEIGRYHDKDTRAIISNMNEPLGNAIGNILEVKEAVNALKGNGPEDLMELCYEAGIMMLIQSKLYKDRRVARKALQEVIDNGAAYHKFLDMVKVQGGDIFYLENPDKFPKAINEIHIYAPRDGYIKKIDALTLGLASVELGAGRRKIEDGIDMSAGIYLHKKVGDYVNFGDKILTFYTNKSEYSEVINNIINAISIISAKVKKPKLILKVIQ